MWLWNPGQSDVLLKTLGYECMHINTFCHARCKFINTNAYIFCMHESRLYTAKSAHSPEEVQ